MKHNITVEGLCYRLRPVKLDDAAVIIDIRSADADRNKYIHSISSDVNEQVQWIENYYSREDDYYFIIENMLTSQIEGLIGIYNIADGRGEWGRWVIRPGSFAAAESVILIYQAAFDVLGLDELYCRTISENIKVISFHDNIGEIRRNIIKNYSEINGVNYDVIEHYSDCSHFRNVIQINLDGMVIKLFVRALKKQIGKFEFHHIGAAVKDIQKEYTTFRILGYKRESNEFEDPNQGIRGLFITADSQPRIELLTNIPGSAILNKFLDNGIKLYHYAYGVEDFDKAMEIFIRLRAKVISKPQPSTYFGKRISFLLLPNMFMIELVEQ